jgi:hypothetical protein
LKKNKSKILYINHENDDIFTEYVLLYDDGRSDLCHERLTSILKFIKNNKIDKYIIKGFKNNNWITIRDRS